MVIYEKKIWNGERKKTKLKLQAKQSISQYNKKMKQGNIKKRPEERRILFLAYILLNIWMDIGETMALR